MGQVGQLSEYLWAGQLLMFRDVISHCLGGNDEVLIHLPGVPPGGSGHFKIRKLMFEGIRCIVFIVRQNTLLHRLRE